MLKTFRFSFVLFLTACTALPKSPLDPIDGQEIVSIEVHDSIVDIGPPLAVQDRVICTIESAEEIQFIQSQLQGLKALRYDHSSPKFDIVLKTKSGMPLRLRISKSEVGQSAPASAFNTHWFPTHLPTEASDQEFALYEFLRKRAFENCTPESPSP